MLTTRYTKLTGIKVRKKKVYATWPAMHTCIKKTSFIIFEHAQHPTYLITLRTCRYLVKATSVDTGDSTCKHMYRANSYDVHFNNVHSAFVMCEGPIANINTSCVLTTSLYLIFFFINSIACAWVQPCERKLKSASQMTF